MAVFGSFTEIGIINQLATAMLAASLPDGVHPSHFAILNHLVRRGDGRTPISIARAMQVTKTTMTHSVQVLGARGFIETRANPDDNRGKLVFLTETGRGFRDTAIAQVTSRFDQVLTPEIRAILDKITPDLVALRQHLDAARD